MRIVYHSRSLSLTVAADLARANFDHQRRTLATRGRGDSRQDGFAREEMLPQPPPQG